MSARQAAELARDEAVKAAKEAEAIGRQQNTTLQVSKGRGGGGAGLLAVRTTPL